MTDPAADAGGEAAGLEPGGLSSARVAELIRQAVAGYGRLSVDVDALGDTDDLFRAGMSSYANVDVMLAIEQALDVEFPERLLRRSTFESLSAIHRAVGELLAGRSVA